MKIEYGYDRLRHCRRFRSWLLFCWRIDDQFYNEWGVRLFGCWAAFMGKARIQ